MDFWGVILPAYLGAGGTVVAAAIAAAAFYRDVSTRKGLREVATAANAEVSLTPNAPGERPAVIASTGEIEFINADRVSLVRNVTRRLVEISDVTTSTVGAHLTLQGSIPHIVQPGEALGIRVHKSLGASPIVTVLVRWRVEQGEWRESTFFA